MLAAGHATEKRLIASRHMIQISARLAFLFIMGGVQWQRRRI